MARLTPVLLVVLMALAIGVGLLAHRLGEVSERLAALESAPRALEVLEGGTAGPELARGGPAPLSAAASARLEELARRLDGLEKRPVAGGASAGGNVQELVNSPAFAESVRKLALELATRDVAFRAAVANTDRTKLGEDPPFGRVAAALELDSTQEAEFRKGIQGMQAELFQLLAEPRDDGVIPMERIQEAEGMGANDPRKAQVFIELFTMKIPGSDETYMERATTLTSEFQKRARALLQPRQQELFDSIEIKYFDVKFD